MIGQSNFELGDN